ncbi:ATP-dependent helicase/nuclease subunit A [Planctomycetaceae bacterium]|nr:ATP-dependent helicase/nuclease subunit A [Planctomycetaceae bacterium]
MIPAPAECEKLNDAQKAALDCERDLLVDAGAGAGKTLVLSLRVLALIEEGRARVSEIVAFTFTEKAAAEMRARVQDLLLKRIAQLEHLAAKDSEINERLKRLRAARGEFNLCRISTVHAFCHRLLAEHAWEAGLEPGAPMLEDREQRLTRDAAINRVLTRTRENDDAECASALTRLGAIARLSDLRAMFDRMLRERHEVQPALAHALAAWSDPEAELERRRRAHATLLETALVPALNVLKKLPLKALSSVKAGDTLRGEIEAVMAAARGCPEPESARALAKALLKGDGEPKAFAKGNRKNWASALEAMESALEALREAAALLSEYAGEVLSFELNDEHELRTAATLRDVNCVLSRVLAAYEEERAGSLDYLELELATLKLLRGDEDLREEVCRHARYMLIDEYQDTNSTQSALFELLVERAHFPGRLFAVGDAKQSIYGFRGADVSVFNEARGKIPARNEAAGVKSKQRLPWEMECKNTAERRRGLILLDTNYRTEARLLKLGNTLLDPVLKRDKPERFDAPPQPLEPGRKLKEGERKAALPLEMHFLPTARGAEAGAQDEPELLAQRVEQLRAEGVKLSDIAILARRRSRNAQYARAFARRQIPLVALKEGGLLQTQEALDCISILRALANPTDDIALLGWLRSPFGGLSDDALMALAPDNYYSTPPLFERMKSTAPDSADDREARLRFLENFAALSARVGREAPSAILAAALEQCSAPMSVSCGAQAEQRTANLQRMVEVVRELEPRFASPASLSRELLRRVQDKEEEAQGEPEQGGEYVRLMTIHGAKGLEFPVVIVPDIGNTRSGGDNGWLRALPAAKEPLGLHLPWLGDDDERGSLRPDFAAWQAGLEQDQREIAEYRRLFYVAFTRARDQLILTGAVPTELHQGEGASWAELMLAALGCVAFGNDARKENGLSVQWRQEMQRSEARPLVSDVQRAENALTKGEIPLAHVVDATLAAPLAVPQQEEEVAPDSTEFGTLVHAELERRILARHRGTKMSPRLDIAGQHADNAQAALGKLRKARELPEWRVFDGENERRMDLLRVGDDEFEIVDFKTDIVAGDPQVHAREHYGEQLRTYAGLLRKQLTARKRPVKNLRLLVCFTHPDVPEDRRLVEIPEEA